MNRLPRLPLQSFFVFLAMSFAWGQAQSARSQQTGANPTTAQSDSNYHLLQTLPLPFLKNPDSLFSSQFAAGRLFIGDGKNLTVIDANAGSMAGTVRGIGHVSGIVLAPDAKQAFAVDSRSGDLMFLDLQKLVVLRRVRVGPRLSLVLYDPSAKEVFAASTRSTHCFFFDATTGKLIKTLKAPGYVFGGALDGKGHIYVTLSRHGLPDSPGLQTGDIDVVEAPVPDVTEVAKLDEKSLAFTDLWKEPCQQVSFLGFDEPRQQLIAGCDDSVLSLDDQTGKVMNSTMIKGAQARFRVFDSRSGDLFGIMALPHQIAPAIIVAHESSAGKFVDPRVLWEHYWQGFAVDETEGRLFILTGDERTVRTAIDLPRGGQIPNVEIPRPAPGTLRLLVYNKN